MKQPAGPTTVPAVPENPAPGAESAPPTVPPTRCGPAWRGVVVALTCLGILLTLSQVFYWNPFGRTLLINEFLYLVLACFLPVVFIVFPVGKRHGRDRVPAYDAVLATTVVAVNSYFALHGERILTEGWDYVAPPLAVAAAYVQWALVLEALRRTAGLVVTGIAAAFSLYPLIAGGIPFALLEGIQYDFVGLAQMHTMGAESVLGLPLQTAASILVGFLLFGVVLQHTGGAAFFYDFAQSVFGTSRGGSAKVSVASSATLGMMSGSAVSNVLTTGPMTIPAMKRAGFTGRYAAGVEATASSGGSVTPPIMGTAAFLMVSFLGVPYSEIALAAAIPALLFFLGIYTQVDAYAARKRLHGLPRADLPRLLPVLLRGWPFLLAIAALLFLLVYHHREAQAPFVVVAGLLAYAMVRRRDRLGGRRVTDLFFGAGRSIAEIIGIIAGVGLIIGGLSMTGVSLSLAREMVHALGGSVALVLIAGAVTSFVLGMGMTVSAVYVLLAIVLAPALVGMGIDPIAAHLFVIYWATVSYITPPVGLAAFAAAGIAGTRPIPTSLTAMRLGAVKYVVPFCFVLDPALVGRAEPGDIVLSVLFATIGVVVMGSAFEGYLIGVERTMGPVVRGVALVAGLALLVPGTATGLAGLVVAAAVALVVRFRGSPPAPGAETALEPSGAEEPR
ncbi:TRAP transporter permease [Nocardiopsis ganjiahuensis]|uniref:TRAP transporter permease n=1 Tax=Nocardiopsis ganjiahuensis TaxID=239984 RepID=UPI0003462037|nr:TRAP transporter fused permease subunit [Nocardiopsis ganjiahuensis]